MLRLCPPPDETTEVPIFPEQLDGEEGVVVRVRHLSWSDLLECEERAHARAVRTVLVREIPAGEPDGTARLVPEERTIQETERWERQLAILERGVVSWIGIEGEPSRAALIALYVRYPAAAATVLSAIIMEAVRPFGRSSPMPNGSVTTPSTSPAAARATSSAARSESGSRTARASRAHGAGAVASPTARTRAASGRRRRG